jgi:serine/threonine protein kinase
MAAVAADRELLFGLLALQNGIINQAQLLAAFQAWTLERSKGLADHLVALGHLTPARRPIVEAMAALHLEAHGGDVEKSLAAVPANRGTRDGLASLKEPQIEATLARVGRVRFDQATDRDGQDSDTDRTVSLSLGASTSDGQRFRVLRPHARGGLGEVFVALDSELNREVALKHILERHADDPFSRQRFVAEAEITGSLEHPGVVPVYGLGTYADGRPYYAMRFIRGDSLKEAIGRFHGDEPLKNDPGKRSLALRKLLRRFLDVCNAVDYSHSRGVIHRDIKPANIILGQHGETLVVDWGLAKSVGRADPTVGEQTIAPSSSVGLSETLPGSALGTPAYMSPEQAAGVLEKLGPRSDVYSLGATLYCLLTGKPPFENEDLGAILRAVQAGDFARPAERGPAPDRALEAICLKAMALEPQDRYPTARALADDLERWMADEPVSAWREPLSRRLRRWSRRNRTAVTAAAVALLAALAGLGAVAAVQAKANGELLALTGRLERANAELFDEKSRVQQRFDVAMDAIRTFHTGVSEDFLLREEQFKGLRDKLLKSAADFYGKLGGLLKQQTDRTSRRALAQAEFELAELTAKVGDSKQALDRHREALSLREALAAEPRADAETQAEAARSVLAVGRAQRVIGKTTEAEASFRSAHERLAKLVEAHPGADDHRADLASVVWHLGSLLKDIGRKREVLAWLERSRDAREALAAAEPSNTLRQLELARSLRILADALGDLGQRSKALESGRRAVAILERLVAADPAATETRFELCASQFTVGQQLGQLGQTAAALETYGRMRENARRLVEDNPAVASFQYALARAYHGTGNQLQSARREAEAVEAYGHALEVYRKLVRDHPSVYDYRRRLAGIYFDLGQYLGQSGQTAAALESFGRMRENARRLVEHNPAEASSQSILAAADRGTGALLHHAGREAEAVEAYGHALEVYRKLVRDHPSVYDYCRSLAQTYANLGESLANLGRPVEGLESAREGLKVARELLASNPEMTADSRFYVGMALDAVGRAEARLGRPAEAAATFREAIGNYEAIPEPSRSASARFNLACGHSQLSGVLAGSSAEGDTEARAEADRAMASLRDAVAHGYRHLPTLRIDPDLNVIRPRPDFQLLLLDLSFPTQPFAS